MKPLVLAAHTNNYEIIKILLDRGASLPCPHHHRSPGSWRCPHNISRFDLDAAARTAQSLAERTVSVTPDDVLTPTEPSPRPP